MRLADGAFTTLHVASYARSEVTVRVVRLPTPAPLLAWCREQGVSDAIVGGFFVRPGGAPLGEVRVAGELQPHEPFAAPWHQLRACVWVAPHGAVIELRSELPAEPPGDLLQAGPLLVSDERNVIVADGDREGFSTASHQFDSDITRGRYPRSALALTEDRLLAVVCDGRSEHDAGMSLAELSDALIDLGARSAMNLDGGGSSSLVSAGLLRNHPREEHGIELLAGRPISTALVLEPRLEGTHD